MVNQMELARVEIHQGKIVAMKKWCNNCKRFYYWDPEVQFLNYCPSCHGIKRIKKHNRIQQHFKRWRHHRRNRGICNNS